MLPRDSYHHGNLVEASVEAALELIDASGSFSLRGVAERIGVAHRAVAAQFQNRSGLEAAVAARGFDELCDSLETLTEPGPFIATYAAFALEHPDLYDLMMQQGYRAFERHPSLRDAADRIIAMALTCLAPDEGTATSRRRAVMSLWMLAHGGVSLHRSGVLRGRDDAAFIAELLAIAGLTTKPAGSPQPLWLEPKDAFND